MSDTVPLKLWDLIEESMEIDGATKLHLTVGRPPMVRGPEGLRPLNDEYRVLTWKSIATILTLVVDPEKWDQFDQVGEGEVRLTHGTGKPITLTVFRSSEAWSAVVHL